MVVDDFDTRRSSLIPHETYAPLVVDPNRVLSLAIGLQCLKAIAGWYTKIANHPSLIQKTKLSQSNVLDVRWQFSASASGPDQLGLGIGKSPGSSDDYNAMRYGSQSPGKTKLAGHAPILFLK
jgi:hypothetical protein